MIEMTNDRQHPLTMPQGMRYDAGVSKEMGFDSPMHRCDESRSSQDESAALLFVPSVYGGSNGEPKGSPVRASGARSVNPFEPPPLRDSHGDGFCKPHRLESTMATQPESNGTTTAVIPFNFNDNAVRAIDRDALIDAIAQGLHGTWHCTRVWEAWHVGTMSQDDFEPVDESETPTEIADAVLALLAAITAQAPSQPGFDAGDMAFAAAQGFRDGWTAAQAISAELAGATEMENLQRTAVGWQERALRAERNWVVCRRWAIAGGAPVEKLGDDPDQPFHAASPAIEGESNV